MCIQKLCIWDFCLTSLSLYYINAWRLKACCRVWWHLDKQWSMCYLITILHFIYCHFFCHIWANWWLAMCKWWWGKTKTAGEGRDGGKENQNWEIERIIPERVAKFRMGYQDENRHWILADNDIWVEWLWIQIGYTDIAISNKNLASCLSISLLVLFFAILVLPNPFGSPSHFLDEIHQGHAVVVTFVEEGVRVATHHHIHSLHTPRYVSIDGQPGMADSDDLVDSLLK